MSGSNKLAQKNRKLQNDELARRRVPCLVAYLNPFRIVENPTLPPWNITIEDVNKKTWDYVALHEMVGGIDVGLTAPYHMTIARDGALALPPLPELRNDQQIVEFFNRCLAALLLGGLYCEAITLDGLDFGTIIDWKYIRVHSHGRAASNRFHEQIRMRQASTLEAIGLHSPRTVQLKALDEAMKSGRAVLEAIPEVSVEFLLKGVTGIARRDWGTALANLWIIVEQITSGLWKHHVLANAQKDEIISGRSKQLADPRTWTIAARHELLHQIGILPISVLGKLSAARKSRNDLVHIGKHPQANETLALYEAVLALLSIAAPSQSIPLAKLNLSDHSLSDPFAPKKSEKIEPSHWMGIPKLPGEAELEKLEATQLRQKRSKKL
ncbi:MAG: hypothetical protein SFW63_01490 [Alphaproteobacteria bacterium]|nr:hypothetical protein [Alphaproteobacteria bacterium]